LLGLFESGLNCCAIRLIRNLLRLLGVNVDYTVLRGNTREDLVREVKTAIANGWKPLGGIAIIHDQKTNWVIFFQAMTLES
jgi:hypothetical protein